MKKYFETYADAYELYADIVSGRDPDRKNASIFLNPSMQANALYVVQWEAKV